MTLQSVAVYIKLTHCCKTITFAQFSVEFVRVLARTLDFKETRKYVHLLSACGVTKSASLQEYKRIQRCN